MLPGDTSGGIGGGDFFKVEKGQNKILIVGEVITGYEYWTNDDKPVRSREKFADTPNIKVRQVRNDKTGETETKADSQRFFWAMPVYDHKDKSYKLWQVTQKSLRDSLASLQNNPDWGNPIGTYSISIDRQGDNLTTKYTVIANPTKDAEALAAIVAAYSESAIDLDKRMFG